MTPAEPRLKAVPDDAQGASLANRKPNLQGAASPTRQRQIAAAEKQRRAVELRNYGYTFQQIADQLGYRTPTAARDAFMRAMERWGEKEVSAYQAAELSKLDGYLASIALELRAGNLKAIDRALAISDRVCKIKGLYAPVKVQITEEMLLAERERIQAEVIELRTVAAEPRRMLEAAVPEEAVGSESLDQGTEVLG